MEKIVIKTIADDDWIKSIDKKRPIELQEKTLIQNALKKHQGESDAVTKLLEMMRIGTKGSGNKGHKGRPGQVDGSAPGKQETEIPQPHKYPEVLKVTMGSRLRQVAVEKALGEFRISPSAITKNITITDDLKAYDPSGTHYYTDNYGIIQSKDDMLFHAYGFYDDKKDIIMISEQMAMDLQDGEEWAKISLAHEVGHGIIANLHGGVRWDIETGFHKAWAKLEILADKLAASIDYPTANDDKRSMLNKACVKTFGINRYGFTNIDEFMASIFGTLSFGSAQQQAIMFSFLESIGLDPDFILGTFENPFATNDLPTYRNRTKKKKLNLFFEIIDDKFVVAVHDEASFSEIDVMIELKRNISRDTAEWFWNPRGHYFFSNTGRKLVAKDIFDIAGESREFVRILSRSIKLDGEWIEQFRSVLKSEYLRQYMLARGGYSQMTSADWGRIGYALRRQYAYLDSLFMRSSEYSESRLRDILELYTDSGHAMFERATAATWGKSLPAYPGDGTTNCLGHCHCSWDFKVEDRKIVAYWKLDPTITDHCEVCLHRSAEWNPLVLS